MGYKQIRQTIKKLKIALKNAKTPHARDNIRHSIKLLYERLKDGTQ